MAGLTFACVAHIRRLALRWRRLLLLTTFALLLTASVTLRLAPLAPRLPPRPALLLPTQQQQSPGQLLDLPHFRYLVNTDVCGGGQPVTAVLLVHSDARRPGARRAIRTSLPQAVLSELGVRRVFLLADASTTRVGEAAAEASTVTQEVIVEESREHRDLVQGNFIDSYHNMTYKHVMALHWAVSFCAQARWLIKMDDDTLADVFSLLEVLKTLPSRGFLGGNLHQRPRVYRDQANKWSVSRAQWADEFYPPYLSGGLYMVTRDVAQQLLQQSSSQPFFWIDDVYVTGILAERAGCARTGLNRFYVTESRCAADAVTQEFELTRQSPHTVFSPEFVVSTTKQKNFTVLERFNQLTHYCASFPCEHRERHADCFNLFLGQYG